MLQRSLGFAVLALLGLALASDPGQAGDHNLYILDPSTSYNREVSSLLAWVMGFAALVFVVVTAAMTYITVKFRRTGRETAEPVQTHGNDRLEIMWTIIPTVIVLIIFGLTARSMFVLENPANYAGAMKVNVTGSLFWWDFDYPDYQVRNSNELILPVNKPVVFEITSKEAGGTEGAVIHSFRITSLVGTQDAIPGVTTRIWVKPEKVGTYYGQCVELCGASHANMRFRVKVVEQAEFDRFIQGARAYRAARPTEPTLVRGEQLFRAQCQACHAINGVTANQSRIGPDLTFYGNRTTVGAGVWPNTPEYLEPWIKNSPGMKPGSKMPAFPDLTDADLKALSAYLMSHKVEGVDFSDLPRY